MYKRQVGVGAFDLSDCLLIQVQRQKIEDPLLERIIHSYMKEIAEGKISTISRALHIDVYKRQDVGFTSVMLDASTEPFEKNVALTRQVVAYCKPCLLYTSFFLLMQ